MPAKKIDEKTKITSQRKVLTLMHNLFPGDSFLTELPHNHITAYANYANITVATETVIVVENIKSESPKSYKARKVLILNKDRYDTDSKIGKKKLDPKNTR